MQGGEWNSDIDKEGGYEAQVKGRKGNTSLHRTMAFYRNTFSDLYELFSKSSVFSFLRYKDKHTRSMGSMCSCTAALDAL